ncbi:hypothetical protein GCM10027589_18190 [Actinocorallia lasiicapitis]
MIRKRLLALSASVLLLASTGCSRLNTYSAVNDEPVPYDVSALIKPSKKYFGVAVDDDAKDPQAVARFTADAGRKPNMVAFYANFNDLLDVDRLHQIWDGGAVPLIVWEPMQMPLAEVASGRRDAYIASWAQQIRRLDMPVALSFGHEFNGDWYPWGLCKSTRPDSVACKTGYETTSKIWTDAYKRVHDQFDFYGATNAVWIWSPNINDGRGVDLESYWPGPSYVDWIGPIGYFEWNGAGSSRRFGDLFDVTIKEFRKFTEKPILIPETAAPEGPNKAAEIGDLWNSVAARSDVVGAVWFNIEKEKDWRLNSDPDAHAAFRDAADNPVLNLDPRKP